MLQSIFMSRNFYYTFLFQNEQQNNVITILLLLKCVHCYLIHVLSIKFKQLDHSRFGSEPSGLVNPASLAETQAAKQSLSSSVIVSIYTATNRIKLPIRTH